MFKFYVALFIPNYTAFIPYKVIVYIATTKYFLLFFSQNIKIITKQG